MTQQGLAPLLDSHAILFISFGMNQNSPMVTTPNNVIMGLVFTVKAMERRRK
jgi:hypothetical protein